MLLAQRRYYIYSCNSPLSPGIALCNSTANLNRFRILSVFYVEGESLDFLQGRGSRFCPIPTAKRTVHGDRLVFRTAYRFTMEKRKFRGSNTCMSFFGLARRSVRNFHLFSVRKERKLSSARVLVSVHPQGIPPETLDPTVRQARLESGVLTANVTPVMYARNLSIDARCSLCSLLQTATLLLLLSLLLHNAATRS